MLQRLGGKSRHEYLFAVKSARSARVPRIDDKLGAGNDVAIIDAIMIGRNDNGVVGAGVGHLSGFAAQEFVILPGRCHRRNEWVMIVRKRAARIEELEQAQRRALADSSIFFLYARPTTRILEPLSPRPKV